MRSLMGWNTSWAMSSTASLGSPVLAGLLVVVLVEAAHQVLEYGSHGVIVQSGVPHRAVGVQDRFGTEVYLGGLGIG